MPEYDHLQTFFVSVCSELPNSRTGCYRADAGPGSPVWRCLCSWKKCQALREAASVVQRLIRIRMGLGIHVWLMIHVCSCSNAPRWPPWCTGRRPSSAWRSSTPGGNSRCEKHRGLCLGARVWTFLTRPTARWWLYPGLLHLQHSSPRRDAVVFNIQALYISVKLGFIQTRWHVHTRARVLVWYLAPHVPEREKERERDFGKFCSLAIM